MSAMANTTPIVTTVTKAATKEKTPKEADAVPRVNILDFCEEHCEDILPVIMDKICCDNNGGNVFGRLGHRRQSAFERLSDTYLPSTTNSGPDRANSRDHSHRRDFSSSRDHPRSRDSSRGIDESYGNTCSSYRTGARHRYHSRDRDRSRSMKRGRKVNPRYLPCRRAAPAMEDTERTARVWFDELPSESIDGYKDLKAAFLAYFIHQKKYVKDPMEIHNIKQRDGETIEDFMERFKVETGRIKGAPECM
ncbi:reverse transcriptase domain-containing protein [Tanacetum coccineum]|uniref:Reverse transcriptase domain-containing protein n=1 Tax=Tanacetum coccineum TaxID=301880 RepID=A0ABQ4ZTN0_9ASTR